MRLLTPARRRAAGRRSSLPAPVLLAAALGVAAIAPGTAGAAAPATPDRAYELVSTADTGGLDVANRTGGQAVLAGTGSPAGGAALFATLGTAPGGQASDLGFAPLLARRTATGWTNAAVAPALTVPRPTGLPNGSVAAAPDDLSSIQLTTNQPMTAGADTTVQNLFSRSYGAAGDGTPTLLGPATLYAAAFSTILNGSADGHAVLFETTDQLTADAPVAGNGNLYVARDGVTTLVSRGLGGAPLPGGVGATQPTTPFSHLLSPDGRTAFYAGLDNKVYANTDGAVVQASAPQGGTAGNATLWAGSRDGSKVFFTNTTALTADSSPGGRDAYRYDLRTGALTPLTSSLVTGVAPTTLRYVAASDDGDTVYFLSFARLTADTPAAATRPLYRWHAGAINYVGRIDTTNANALSTLVSVSPDGRYLAYPSAQDNTAQPTGGTAQLYRYDATTNTTACASCPADGSAADTEPEPYAYQYGIFQTFAFVSPNSVTADGAVVFTTTAALTSRDVNGKDDVYAWSPGTGPALVSSGTDPAGAQLGDVSRDGQDIYFTTRDRLVSADDDEDADLYDARRGGGFPDVTPPKGAGDCTGDACQGAPPVAPPVPSPASVTFAGPGNAVQDASIPALPGTVRVTKGTIKGGRFTVSVRTPGAGRITISGAHVGTVRRTAARAATYKITVALTAKAKRSLARHKKLKVSVKVGFTPAGEKSSNATLSLTVKA